MALAAVGLSKRFGDCISLTNVSLDFAPGKIHAILGENGAGKSTLLKLLFGIHTPSSGHIELAGQKVEWNSTLDSIKHGLGMVQQHFTLVEPLSCIDNILLGAEICKDRIGRLDRQSAIGALEKLLPSAKMQVPWHTPVAELSVGQKQRVEILKVLFKRAKIIFLDEPTAVLTPFEVKDLFDVLKKLRESGHTIILITHKINEVFEVCDTYSVLRKGELVARGNVEDVSSEELVRQMVGVHIPKLDVARTKPSDQTVLKFENVNAGALRDINFHVRAGEIVGFAGVEGSGQSFLVDVISGLRPPSGRARIFDKDLSTLNVNRVRELGLGWIPEDRASQGLWLEESCSMNLILGLESRFTRAGVLQSSKAENESSEWAKQFDVRAFQLSLPVSALSGGNQQKVIFAREVSGRKPKFLLCHQPTRGVDLGAIDLIHRKMIGLRNEGIGVLVFSSELEELYTLCDRIYVLFSGQITGEFQRGQFDHLKIGAAMTGARE